jgi:Tfp pilus assembly protein PilO
MRRADRAILAGLAILGLLAAFWFLVLSPKRDEVSKLEDEVSALGAEVAEQEALIADGEAARRDFESNYRQLVVLGKAVPEAADTSSLITEFSALSDSSELDFRSFDLVEAGAAPPAPAAAETTVDEPASESGEAEPAPAEGAEATAVPAAATEATAASLPIGATVGPAGLPVMPYAMQFTGGYFDFADFLGGVDQLVSSQGDEVVVDGRLLTIDGFSFSPDPKKGYPWLVGDLSLTSYVAPEDEGLVAGATPTAPPPAAPAPASGTPAEPAGAATPTSSTTP